MSSKETKSGISSSEIKGTAKRIFAVAVLAAAACEPVFPAPTATEPFGETPMATQGTEATLEQASPEPTHTPTAEATPTAAYEFLQSDREIEYLIETASEGERLELENVLLGHVVRIPRPFFSNLVLASLETEKEDGSVQRIAFLENADCVFDEFRESGELGDMLDTGFEFVASGLWRPKIRTNLEATVYIEPQMGAPIVLTAEAIEHRGKRQLCVKDSAIKSSGEWIKQATAELVDRAGRAIDLAEEKLDPGE